MNIKKLEQTFEVGELVRQKTDLFPCSYEVGDMGIVLAVRRREEEDGQKIIWGRIKVYFFSTKATLELYPRNLIKVVDSGTEWYEVGLGDIEVDNYGWENTPCIEYGKGGE